MGSVKSYHRPESNWMEPSCHTHGHEFIEDENDPTREVCICCGRTVEEIQNG